MYIDKIGSADDRTKSSVFLASDYASWITGTILAVDSGLTYMGDSLSGLGSENLINADLSRSNNI